MGLRAEHEPPDALSRPRRHPRLVAGRLRLLVGTRRLRRARLASELSATRAGGQVRSQQAAILGQAESVIRWTRGSTERTSGLTGPSTRALTTGRMSLHTGSEAGDDQLLKLEPSKPPHRESSGLTRDCPVSESRDVDN
jgi:hypothetical protein